MSDFRWGIIGCGLIAPKFFESLKNTGEGTVVAVASKSRSRAKRLQKKLGVAESYRSYAEMLTYEKLDAVYIATSHNYHAENAKLCLERNIPVLVEKSFTRNAEEAQELVALAREKNTFLMEAMWTRFNPATVKMLEMIADGVIGEVKHVKADFCVKMPLGPKTLPWNRMYSRRLAGGALLDLGVYPIALSRMIFDRSPDKISGSNQWAWTGVDKTSTYSLDYGTGYRAELSSSFVETKQRDAVITGTNGIIKMPQFMGADHFVITRAGRAPETIQCEAPGFEHEIKEVHRCLEAGTIESEMMPHEQTRDVMHTMDTLRLQWPMRYPGEEKTSFFSKKPEKKEVLSI
jgi:dihydrodiol dehydrogenase / D-xylose 1-dehydrogenase (NADP)